MPKRFCHHINPAGVFCGGPPVNKRDYCFWHLHENGRRMKAARARARSERVFIHFPVLDDLHAVQVGLMQLGEAINHGEIDHQSGRLLLSVLRLAASNLKSQNGWHQKSDFETFGPESSIVIEDPAFEDEYGLPQDFDLGVPPEVAFPPPPEPSVAATTEQDPAKGADPSRRNRDWRRDDRLRRPPGATGKWPRSPVCETCGRVECASFA